MTREEINKATRELMADAVKIAQQTERKRK
jgi:hypothetical protein